jgi:hypothetical protein
VITIRVTFDDATYYALEEVAGRSLSSPATFLVGMVRKELRLPYPYEDSPLKEHPKILKLITTEKERDQEEERRKRRKQSPGNQQVTTELPPGNQQVTDDMDTGIPATAARGKAPRQNRRNGAPGPIKGDDDA